MIATKLKPAHVRNVEQSNTVSNGIVLFDNGRILDRHFPARKIDHTPVVRMVPRIERCPEHIPFF
jgi:hypothetical protein